MSTMKKYIIPESIKHMPEIKGIIKVLDKISDTSILERLKGNCISGSDMIQNMLHYYDIESKTVECQIFVARENAKVQFLFVGFNNLAPSASNIVDTHVVVVTETNPPLLIDAALGHILPEDNQIVVQPLESNDPNKLGEYKLGDATISYFEKKNLRLPSIHQKNLIDRLRSDQETNRKLTFMQKSLIILGCFSLVNFTLNVVMIILKLIYP